MENNNLNQNNTQENVPLPPSDLPQAPNAGHTGMLADISAPENNKKFMISIFLAVLAAIICISAIKIQAHNAELKAEEQKKSDIRNEAALQIQEQESAWNAA